MVKEAAAALTLHRGQGIWEGLSQLLFHCRVSNRNSYRAIGGVVMADGGPLAGSRRNMARYLGGLLQRCGSWLMPGWPHLSSASSKSATSELYWAFPSQRGRPVFLLHSSCPSCFYKPLACTFFVGTFFLFFPLIKRKGPKGFCFSLQKWFPTLYCLS